MIAKINHRLHGLHGFAPQNHPSIDYLAERQNGVKNPAFSSIQFSRMLACENEFAVRGIPRGVGKFIFAKLRITLVICGQINPELHGLHPKTPLESTPIDYLAERQNGSQINHELHPKTPLETSPIDYLAERQNRGQITRELTPQTTTIDYLAERQNRGQINPQTPLETAPIDYLAERQNRPCRGHQNPVGRDRRARPKNNNGLSELSGLEVKIDYLAERQNGGDFQGRQMRRRSFASGGRLPQATAKPPARARVVGPYRVHSAIECCPVGGDHRAPLEKGSQTTPIDYLAEWENGPWGEELTTEEDAERRESGN